MIIKILGTGCASCVKLEKNVLKALKNLNKEAKVIKVTELKDIMTYGVLNTPALVVDEKVLFYGKSPNVKALMKLLKTN